MVDHWKVDARCLNFFPTAAVMISVTNETTRMRRATNPLLRAGGAEAHRSVARAILSAICGDFPFRCQYTLGYIYAHKAHAPPTPFLGSAYTTLDLIHPEQRGVVPRLIFLRVGSTWQSKTDTESHALVLTPSSCVLLHLPSMAIHDEA